MILNGLRLADSSPLAITLTNAKIEAIACGGEPVAGTTFVAPGFIDLQVNGWGGIAFNDPRISTEQIESVTSKLWQTGVARFCPTLVTDSFENLAGGVAAIARARTQSPAGRSIVGVHLEGPYLSPEDGPRGAHPRAHIRPPDWDEFRRLYDAAEGGIALLTIAPEVPGAIPFIERLAASGVKAAIGHTAAGTAQIREAIAAGATMSTHLGNAAHDQLQRHHNYIYDQLADDRLWASLIVDGHHLPPSLVKIFVRAKRPERTILVSDAMHWAGMPPGRYPFGAIEVEVHADGWIGVVGQPRLAGSGLLLGRGIENAVRFAELALDEAIDTVTKNPATFLGVCPQYGSLEVGSDATFTLFDWDGAGCRLTVKRTIVAGETVYQAPEESA